MSVYGHLVFNGQTRRLKMYITGAADLGHPDGLIHEVDCHDVGINDGKLADPYGEKCKCPPGDYIVGAPMACATRVEEGGVRINNDDDRAYGCWFVPLSDESPDGGFAQHGRAGIGLHGGGSDLPDPFAMNQGWEYTYGCLRLQNTDLEHCLVPFVNFVHTHGGQVKLSVVWE
jgi:hypothetical protein